MALRVGDDGNNCITNYIMKYFQSNYCHGIPVVGMDKIR